jgi:hypothetical protein
MFNGCVTILEGLRKKEGAEKKIIYFYHLVDFSVPCEGLTRTHDPLIVASNRCLSCTYILLIRSDVTCLND